MKWKDSQGNLSVTEWEWEEGEISDVGAAASPPIVESESPIDTTTTEPSPAVMQ